jgi:hypothetical protein
VVLSVVSGLSITAGVGSKESEGDLLRAMAIPFGVLEGVIDAAEGGLSSTRQLYCVDNGMVMGLLAEAAVVNKSRGFGKYDNCPDEMVLV